MSHCMGSNGSNPGPEVRAEHTEQGGTSDRLHKATTGRGDAYLNTERRLVLVKFPDIRYQHLSFHRI